MAKTLHAIIFFALISMAGQAFAATHYVAANGSDANNGTSKSTPWQHAPGMPNCVSACASYTPVAGDQIIFRGGDTWHFGNSGATPYTGGTWVWHWSGTSTSCDMTDAPNPVETSCVYIGVDPTWYSGASWTRPIMTNDNPTSTKAVSSCPYPNVGGYLGGYDETMVLAGVTFVIVDNFEWTGQCNASSSQGGNIYIHERIANATITQNRYSNNYFHGFTHLPFNCSSGGLCESNEAFTVSIGSTIGPGNVCDGSDSDPTSITCLTPGGGGWLTYGNVWANQAQMVANGCHIWHDNYWFGYTYSGDGVAHGNQLECNNSSPQNDANGHSQPSTTANLFYNNVMGHNSSGTGGDVKLQFAVNSTYPWYVFDNIIYDQGSGNTLNWGGTGVKLPTGNQYFFSNTFDIPTSNDKATCYTGIDYQNNLFIVEGGTAISGGDGGCTQSNNTVMSHATAVSQGYMANGTGTSGNNSNVTCANDNTPCAPTAKGNSTVGAGTDVSSYCSTLAGSSDPVVARAGAACLNGTTDSCAYNQTTHAVTCPRQTPVARNSTTAWDTGADQYNPQATTGGSTGTSSNCSATEKNADYSVDNGSSSSVSMNANISAVGDLVAITAYCYSACTPVSVQLGNQTAVETTIPGNPGPGSPGTGQGFIFYVLSAAAAGTQTLTFKASGSYSDIQTSYIDFGSSSGCSFKHDVDYPVGTGTGGTVNTPVITPNAGDLLFNFVYTSEHVNAVNSPWSCPIYKATGETLTCEFVNTVNTAAYILSAPSTSVASNATLIHSTDSWQSLITSFSMTGTAQTPNPPTSVKASAVAH
ncbi:MAG TPA: hypothetical protein VHD85_12610 [Terracidiphilus sp.]|nr:hypothetical protein [Terracidiphilus sp.]